jgi:hypothetical protein
MSPREWIAKELAEAEPDAEPPAEAEAAPPPKPLPRPKRKPSPPQPVARPEPEPQPEPRDEAEPEPQPVKKPDLPEWVRKKDKEGLAGLVRKDLAAVGLVGERNNALLVYLVYLSRLLKDPGAVIARGRLAAGKSTLLKKVALLVPPGSKIEAMAMTPAVWFNTVPDYFRNKLFVAGERKHSTTAEARDAGAMLRQLLSEKRINRMTSVYDEKAKAWTAVHIDREGPVAYAETTTAKSVFEEDLNRLLQVHVDESEGQNRDVVLTIGRRYDPGAAAVDVEAVIKRHHEFQAYLESLPAPEVVIPYWRVIAEGLPAKRAECRRVAQQVFTIIEASALLHSHERRREDGRLWATEYDYSLAWCLLLDPVRAALGVSKEYVELRKKLKAEVFTAAQVKLALGCNNDMTPWRVVMKLMEEGRVEVRTEARGQSPAIYGWVADAGVAEGDVLPSFEAVRRACLTA